jgi:5-methyltetrahydropteroyltriglutamate--homocysteine methyltransferase
MLRSGEKILTTHTGSLPRPPKVVELLLAEKAKPGESRAALDAAVADGVAGVVKKQIEAGIDIINDGEQGRTDYTVHVLDRLTGFEGESTPPLGTGEPEFPELAAILSQFATPFQHRPACSGPVAWKDWPAVEADIARAKAALTKSGAAEWFMTSPSPGQIARYLKNRYYKTDEEYLFALAGVMAREYRAIVEAVSCCSSIAPTSRCPTRCIRESAFRNTGKSSRRTSRRSTRRSRISRPTACACTSAGARRSVPTTATSR